MIWLREKSSARSPQVPVPRMVLARTKIGLPRPQDLKARHSWLEGRWLAVYRLRERCYPVSVAPASQ